MADRVQALSTTRIAAGVRITLATVAHHRNRYRSWATATAPCAGNWPVSAASDPAVTMIQTGMAKGAVSFSPAHPAPNAKATTATNSGASAGARLKGNAGTRTGRQITAKATTRAVNNDPSLGSVATTGKRSSPVDVCE